MGRQKLVASLLTAGTTELHNIIKELGEVDVVGKVIEMCGKVAFGVTELVDELEAGTGELNQLNAQANELQSEMDQQREANEKNEALHDKLVPEVQGALDALEIGRKRNLVAEQMNTALDTLRSSVRSAEQLLSSADIPAPLTEEQQAKADEEEEALRHLTSIVEDTRTALNANVMEQQRRDELQQRLDRLPEVKHIPEPTEGTKRRVANLEASADRVRGHLADAKAGYTKAVEAAEQLECPTCHRPYDSSHSKEDMLAEVERYKKKGFALRDNLREIDSELTAERSVLAEYEQAQSQAYRVSLARDQIIESMSSAPVPGSETVLRDELRELEDRKASVTASLKSLRDIQQKATLAKQAYRLLQESLDDREKELSAYLETYGIQHAGHVFPVRDLSDLREKHESLRQQENDVHNALCSGSVALRGMSKQADQIAHSKRNLTDRLHQIGDKVSRGRTASSLQKYLRSNRDKFLAMIWSQITSSASAFSRAVTEGAVQSLRRTDDGFEWNSGEDWYGPEDASGAQATIMGIGIQQALATALPCGLDTVLLDEPTADSSEEVSAAIMTMLAGMGRQVIVVSHKHQDAASARNLIDLT